MTQTIRVPRAFGGTLILTITAVQQQPGNATISDTQQEGATISDALLDQATASDTAVGSVTLTDQ